MSVPRTKTFLFLALKEWAQNLRPGDLNLSKDFELEVHNVTNNSLMLRIKDPTTGPHYYEVKVTEKI